MRYAETNKNEKLGKRYQLSSLKKIFYEDGTWGSLRGIELDSVDLHLCISIDWRAAGYCHHTPEGGRHINRKEPVCLGGTRT
jgi:hypothetical protein